MLKTNSKKVKEKIKNYIIKLYDDEGYNVPKATTFEEMKENIKKVSYNEVIKYELMRRSTLFDAFEYWCSGLPYLLNTADYYCHNSAIDILGDILEETEEERSRFSELEAEKKLTYLIFREIF